MLRRTTFASLGTAGFALAGGAAGVADVSDATLVGEDDDGKLASAPPEEGAPLREQLGRTRTAQAQAATTESASRKCGERRMPPFARVVH